MKSHLPLLSLLLAITLTTACDGCGGDPTPPITPPPDAALTPDAPPDAAPDAPEDIAPDLPDAPPTPEPPHMDTIAALQARGFTLLDEPPLGAAFIPSEADSSRLVRLSSTPGAKAPDLSARELRFPSERAAISWLAALPPEAEAPTPTRRLRLGRTVVELSALDAAPPDLLDRAAEAVGKAALTP